MKKAITTFLSFLVITTASAQNLYGGMENWRSFSGGSLTLEAPDHWYGLDSVHNATLARPSEQEIFKTTDAHSGSYAVKIVTKKRTGGTDRIDAAVLVNAQPIDWDTAAGALSYLGGTTLTQKPTSLTAWVKFIPGNAQDRAVVSVNTAQNPQTTGISTTTSIDRLNIQPASSYTKITVPFNYINNLIPNFIFISFSSTSEISPVEGSTLYVDDVMLDFQSGISLPLFSEQLVKLYPNPSNGVINFETASTAPLTWEAIAVDGRVVATQTFTGKGSVTINGAPGVYSYRIKDAAGKLLQNGSFGKR